MPTRVLVVDDEPSIRTVLSAQLRRQGHEVLTAEDGEAAKEVLGKNAVDAVITDLRMPRLDGIGLVRWIRGQFPEVPVIVITAFGTVESAVDALKQGAFDYVTKPFDQDELRATLEDALQAKLEPPADIPPADASDADDLKEYVRRHTARLERHRIRQVLEVEHGNVTRAAKKLGISRRSLQTKMKEYGLRET